MKCTRKVFAEVCATEKQKYLQKCYAAKWLQLGGDFFKHSVFKND